MVDSRYILPFVKEGALTKRLDPDFKGLKGCVRAMECVTPRMRKATLEFLWDRYVTHPPKAESPATNPQQPC